MDTTENEVQIRKVSELIFQFLYQVQIQQNDVEAQLAQSVKDLGKSGGLEAAELREYESKIRGILAMQNELDEEIRAKLVRWTLERTSPVDRAILRLALYEIVVGKPLFAAVASQAVLLAKRYSNPGSRVFINGMLAQFDPKRHPENCQRLQGLGQSKAGEGGAEE